MCVYLPPSLVALPYPIPLPSYISSPVIPFSHSLLSLLQMLEEVVHPHSPSLNPVEMVHNVISSAPTNKVRKTLPNHVIPTEFSPCKCTKTEVNPIRMITVDSLPLFASLNFVTLAGIISKATLLKKIKCILVIHLIAPRDWLGEIRRFSR